MLSRQPFPHFTGPTRNSHALRFVFAALLLLCGLSVRLGEGAWKAIELDLEVTPAVIEGSMGLAGTLRVRLEEGHSTKLRLALEGGQKELRFVEIDGPADAEIELNQPHPERQDVLLATLTFERPREAGDEFEVDFFCEATRESNQFQVDEGITFASWVEGWYPFLPDDSVSLSRMMSIPGTTRFHLPAGWDALSNGIFVERNETPEGVEVVWRSDLPVARSFAAGPYRVERHSVGEREIGVYLLPETSLDLERQTRLLARALAAQEERFGPYPYATYGIAEVPVGSGGFYASSEQGFIMARSGAFDWEHGNLPLWGHEMAHGWWGNLVGTEGPGSLVCGESLAQYSAVVAIEAIEGKEAATEFLRFSRSGYSPGQCARGYFEMVQAGVDRPLSMLNGDGHDHQLSDAKGHWIYHMLRRRVGDGLFFEGLRGLLVKYANKDMSLDEVRAHFIQRAPDARLETFFEQWLDRTGAPVLAVKTQRVDDERIEFTLLQQQKGEPYDLDLELELRFADGSRREQLRTSEKEIRWILESTEDPEEVILDPDHELFIWNAAYGDQVPKRLVDL